jgi:hypothetical protein
MSGSQSAIRFSRIGLTILIAAATVQDRAMMFRRDRGMIPNVLIHGHRWNVRVTPHVLTVPIKGAKGFPSGLPFVNLCAEAREWFLANQRLFDLEGLT